MKREEAIKAWDKWRKNGHSHSAMPNSMALVMAYLALRGPTREQVEAWGGEWIKRHKHHGGFRRVKGIDDIGEQHEVTIDERCEYDDLYCTKCGKQSPDNFLNFCGYCGSPMTDEAVEITLQRLEALKDGTEAN